MSNHHSVVVAVTVLAVVVLLLAATISVSAYPGSPIRYPSGPPCKVPMATVGKNTVFMTWPNNDTGHSKVFFAKSTDGGKTLKIMMISAPNKGHTIDTCSQISASGSNVYVSWRTNKTGTLTPVFRASNDGGTTFGPITKLNSTSGVAAK